MSHDTGDEHPSPAPTRRFFRVEEIAEADLDTGLSHWIVAKNLSHALEVLAQADLGDSERVNIWEIRDHEAAEMFMRNEAGERFPLTEAALGDHFSEEF